MAIDKQQMAKPKALGIPHALLRLFQPRPMEIRNGRIVHLRTGFCGEKKFFDRSDDVYENKGEIIAGFDRSHDLYENIRVVVKSGVMPRYY